MFRWQSAVKGLCGNYNGDGSDDLTTPGGLTESSAILFGDSWKLHSYCPIAHPQGVGIQFAWSSLLFRTFLYLYLL